MFNKRVCIWKQMTVKQVDTINQLLNELTKNIENTSCTYINNFNKVFNTAIFPECLKLVIVTPIYKSGSRKMTFTNINIIKRSTENVDKKQITNSVHDGFKLQRAKVRGAGVR